MTAPLPAAGSYAHVDQASRSLVRQRRSELDLRCDGLRLLHQGLPVREHLIATQSVPGGDTTSTASWSTWGTSCRTHFMTNLLTDALLVPRRVQPWICSTPWSAPSTSNPPLSMRYTAQLDRVTDQLGDRFPRVASRSWTRLLAVHSASLGLQSPASLSPTGGCPRPRSGPFFVKVWRPGGVLATRRSPGGWRLHRCGMVRLVALSINSWRVGPGIEFGSAPIVRRSAVRASGWRHPRLNRWMHARMGSGTLGSVIPLNPTGTRAIA